MPVPRQQVRLWPKAPRGVDTTLIFEEPIEQVVEKSGLLKHRAIGTAMQLFCSILFHGDFYLPALGHRFSVLFSSIYVLLFPGYGCIMEWLEQLYDSVFTI